MHQTSTNQDCAYKYKPGFVEHCEYDYHTYNNHIVVVEISIQISFELNYSVL